MLIRKEKRHELDPIIWEAIFIGQCENRKRFLLWHLKDMKVSGARFVKFNQTGDGLKGEDINVRTESGDENNLDGESNGNGNCEDILQNAKYKSSGGIWNDRIER